MTDDSWVTRLKRVSSKYPKTREEIQHFLKLATHHEVLETNTLSMLEGVLDVQETRVHDVMVSRLQMTTIGHDMQLEQIIPIVARSGHSRFPVTGSSKDEVLGIILAKDLLNYGFNGNKVFNIRDILRPAVFIPESKRLNVLLQDFRLNRSHMAIVVDEYGRITGLITIEDVLEQIVGEIADEHDIESIPPIQAQADGSYLVKALASLEEFDEFFNSSLNTEGVETIGGLVMRSMGHLPVRGESITIGTYKFTVLRADNRRVHLLNVSENLD